MIKIPPPAPGGPLPLGVSVTTPAADPTPAADFVPRVSTTTARPGTAVYPQADSYTWGEFADLAIELGGYGDITAVNPYTGTRLCLLNASEGIDPGDPRGHFTMLHRLIDALETNPEFFQG